MVRRSVFDEVEGLNEEFKVAFNDIDFCLKVRKAGYLVVYNPYASSIIMSQIQRAGGFRR